jgi:hypothetical protein
MYRHVVYHISATNLSISSVETRPKAYLRICLKQIHKVTPSVLFLQINFYGWRRQCVIQHGGKTFKVPPATH